MKKRLNTDAIATELREHSGFFRRPAAPEPKEVSVRQDTAVPRPPGVRAPGRHDAKASRRPGSETPRSQDAQTPGHPPASASEPVGGKRYDLVERAEERQTLRLTEGEFRRLGVLQGSLSEQLGVRKVDKNDIIRAALHRLYEEVDGQGSDVVARLRKKYR